MIQHRDEPPKTETGKKVRSAAVQFRDWLSKSLQKQELAFDDKGVLALHTLMTMKGKEVLGLGGDETGRWVVGMGAFLSECIRARFGGEYFASGDQGFGLRVTDSLTVYPLRWIQEYLSGSREGSILARYEMLISMHERGRGE
jgi:hypothetical protein